MARARDVAAAIIQMADKVDQMKLQKLLYYGQGWNLAWYGEPLFTDAVEAWAWGPAVGDVYMAYKDYGDEPITEPHDGDPAVLDERQRSSLAAVIAAYGQLDGPELAELTHNETPWVRARVGYERGQRSRRAISRGTIERFFKTRNDFGGLPIDELPLPDETLKEAVARGEGSAIARLIEEGLGVRIKSAERV